MHREWASSIFRKVLITLAAIASLGLGASTARAQQVPVATQSAAPASQTQAASAPAPEFVYDVASIKPSKPGAMDSRWGSRSDAFTGENITVMSLLTSAYAIDNKNQFSGVPDWLNSERYDVQAKMDPSVADALKKLPPDQRALARQRMLQALLADRFGLKIHRETKQLPMYVLEVAKGGPKLKPTAWPPSPSAGAPNAPGAPGAKDSKPPPPPPLPPARKGSPPAANLVGGRGSMWSTSHGQATIAANGGSVAQLSDLLSRMLGRPVVDKTGLTGEYDYTLQWTAEVQSSNTVAAANPTPAAMAPAPLADSGPTIFAAIQQQLGLKLESIKGPVEIIVIDHVNRPSEN